MKPAQINFVKECLPAAVSAGAAFNLNPLVILAQAAFESGWGTSNLAKECRNYFGLTAYGCSNAYWHGGKTTVKASSYPFEFPTLRHTREFLPRFRPLDTEQLSLRLAGKQRPAGLCKGDRLQSLHQRTERR